jgi:hypothetical protein
MNLLNFTTDNLFAATTDFFEQLGIKLNSNTAQSLNAESVLGEHHKDRRPFVNIKELYFAGLIDDSIFQKDRQSNGITLEEAQSKTYKSVTYVL